MPLAAATSSLGNKVYSGDQTDLPPGATAGFQSALDKQVPTSFGPWTFPATYHDLDGEQRDHIHEYSHRDAGAPEKLGRRLYTVSLTAQFHDNFPQFPDLYPYTIDQLQLAFEKGETHTFVHPSVGKFPAYIKKWRRRRDPKNRSGELVEMVVREDQQSQFLQGDIANVAHFASLDSTSGELAQQLKAVQKDLNLDPPTLSLFGAIQTLANDITGISDTAGMYGNLVLAKSQQLQNICAQLDGALGMQDARAYPVVEALHQVWQQAQLVTQDAQAKRQKLQTYIVPTTMSISQVATRIYGDASRADDLLAINANAIPDPLSIKPPTPLLYYPS